MITSSSNSQVKNLIQLLNKSKVRREQDAFVIEGLKMFREAPKDRLVKVYVSEKFISNQQDAVCLAGVSYEVIRDDIFRHISDTVNPQGILAVVKMIHNKPEDVLHAGDKGTFLILEDIRDPGNLGTIMRTAEGAGVDGIIMTENTVDIYNPKVVRSTMGAIYRIPFFYTDSIGEIIGRMKAEGILVAAAHLRGTVCYYNGSFDKKVAFIVGNESSGIKDSTADMADLLVKIPMEGCVESLNASVAASLLIYEAYRQKSCPDAGN